MKSVAPFAFLLVIGCSPMASLKQDLSTENDVRRAMGRPTQELALEDGTRQLAYPRGPVGTETFMVFLHSDGRVARFEQVLTEDQFGRIVSGRTTREEVRRLIGPPGRVIRFENLNQDAWVYRFRDSWGYVADFSAMIDDRGIVASKVIARIDGGRDRSR